MKQLRRSDPEDRRRRTASAGRRVAASVVGLAAVIGLLSAPVSAQSWWPFGGDNEQAAPAPVPSEPVYRPQPVPAPIPGAAPSAAPNWASKNPICLQLEQRLVKESQKGDQWRTELPKIEAEIRTLDRTYNVGSSKLDSNCYEYFLFTKSFRSTTQCRALRKEVETAKRRLSELETQRQTLVSSGGRSYQNDIIRELARNNCGANYTDMARRSGGSNPIWSDDDSPMTGEWAPRGGTGVATYRTLCVRRCDGYYFPISFSTLPSHFPQDAAACQSRCAAPAELFYYPNPGGTVDQSVALASQQPYTQQKFAFRYRKEFVEGCSCKVAEYKSPDGEVGKTAAQSSWSADSITGPAGARIDTTPPPPLPPVEQGQPLAPRDNTWDPDVN